MEQRIEFHAPMRNARALRQIQESTLTGLLPIISVFRTIEGEGQFVGTPRVFVRVGGCAVGCTTCDTTYSWYPGKYPYWSIQDVFNEVGRIAQVPDQITITGGEPMHYPEQIVALAQMFHDVGHKVNLETSGAILDSQVMSHFDFISLDIKTPSSGVPFEGIHVGLLTDYALSTPNVYVKAVVANAEDLKYLEENFKPLLLREDNPLVLTPCADTTKKALDHEDIRKTVSMILEWNREYHVRTIVQQHKFIDYDTHR